jgi:hypothetical protein
MFQGGNMKTKTTTFVRDQYGHYHLNKRRVTLEVIRQYIRDNRKFRVISKTSGRNLTAKAISHALAYRYVKNGKRTIGEMKAAIKVLT